MTLEQEKQEFQEIIDRIPEITMNSPSFPLELAEHINDLPFLSAPETPHDNECFCEKDDEESLLITCACCGERSHLSCYHLTERPITSDSFFCIYCQQKASQKISNELIKTATCIEQKLNIITEKLDEIESENMHEYPDPFACIQNATSCQELHSMFTNLLATSQSLWDEINQDLEQLNAFTDIDIFDQRVDN